MDLVVLTDGLNTFILPDQLAARDNVLSVSVHEGKTLDECLGLNPDKL